MNDVWITQKKNPENYHLNYTQWAIIYIMGYYLYYNYNSVINNLQCFIFNLVF